jgi:hypothetical protein
MKKPRLQYLQTGLFGSGNSWNRTNDTSIFSAVLYQLSYVAGVFRGPVEAAWECKGTISGLRRKFFAEKISDSSRQPCKSSRHAY